MNPANIHVLPHAERGWVLCREGNSEPLSHHAQQATAVAEASTLAISEQVELVVHDRLGKIAKRLRAS